MGLWLWRVFCLKLSVWEQVRESRVFVVAALSHFVVPRLPTGEAPLQGSTSHLLTSPFFSLCASHTLNNDSFSSLPVNL